MIVGASAVNGNALLRRQYIESLGRRRCDRHQVVAAEDHIDRAGLGDIAARIRPRGFRCANDDVPGPLCIDVADGDGAAELTARLAIDADDSSISGEINHLGGCESVRESRAALQEEGCATIDARCGRCHHRPAAAGRANQQVSRAGRGAAVDVADD